MIEEVGTRVYRVRGLDALEFWAFFGDRLLSDWCECGCGVRLRGGLCCDQHRQAPLFVMNRRKHDCVRRTNS